MGDTFHTPFSPYYEIKTSLGSGVLNLLNIIELFWGLNFLREASIYNFNLGVYIGSGLVIKWYTERPLNPVKGLFKHWGSVIACSFMVGFFGMIDMIYLLISPRQDS